MEYKYNKIIPAGKIPNPFKLKLLKGSMQHPQCGSKTPILTQAMQTDLLTLDIALVDHCKRRKPPRLKLILEENPGNNLEDVF
jgi:hypothetical protein